MTTRKASAKPLSSPRTQPIQTDGRRERSRSSRARIVAAMLELIAKGDFSPSAARVAEVAGVGLRSVFRHFEDMDALFREISDTIEDRVLPIINQPPKGDTWQERLIEIAERRAKVFEMMMPYRLSAEVKRLQSPYLMQNYRRTLQLEGESIDAHLPEHIAADILGTQAIKVILCFQTWRYLRDDQQLPVQQAKAVIKRMLSDSLAAMGDA